MTIGLVGIGLVGAAIAERLLGAGNTVVGFDIAPERCRLLTDLGGIAAASNSEVGASAETVIVSLLRLDIVHSALFGTGGLLGSPAKVSCVIDTTTGDPAESVRLARLCRQREVVYLDATISGSSEQVRQGEAVFMVGGNRTAFEASYGVMKAIVDSIHFLGESGSGSKAKLATNLILGLNRLALAEGLVFAESLGFDLEQFLELLRQTPAYSRAVDTKGSKMVRSDFIPESRVSQHHKDLEVILSLAEKSNRALPLAALHSELLQRLIDSGRGGLDSSAVIEALRSAR